MNNYRLTIAYDGSRYKGWQRLKDNDQTIQGKIENVLTLMVGQTIEIIGSGRTDAGVHALHQVANFKIQKRLKINEIMEYLNHYLPDDIVVLDVSEVSDRFHARYNATHKQYLYRINNSTYKDPFTRKYTYHLSQSLNITQMNKAASYFLGEKDFKSFTTMKSKKKSTVRKINSIDIAVKDGEITFLFDGDGFLYNMVRIIVGTLIEVGLGHMKVDAIPEIFKKMERQYAGPTAPAQGLFLKEVFYN
ncbi:tRNA pseudouridine(38-40) synthase TruA [Vallitalea okinawensis]|uniref:tRNA pseudouridine(38-40) synthase TruA n=1 Tax=Vallitalea okinawensis TaxID=2078660 RepID=UPI000CFB1EDE|nr:tRNA pseudouridine(38-40) synthase TruA [Vallitalea okinawensis]